MGVIARGQITIHVAEKVKIRGLNLISNRPANWEQGTFNFDCPVGATYDQMKATLPDTIRIKELLLVDDIFTLQVKSGFKIALAFFDADKRYLGQSQGFQSWISTYPYYRSSSVDYILVVVKKTNGANIIPQEIADVFVKVETGDEATPWSPSMGDVNEMVVDAKDSADDALRLLSDMADDNKLTSKEKFQIRKEWETIKKEYIEIGKQAEKYEIAIDGLDDAYRDLNIYLQTLNLDSPITTIIVSAEFIRVFTEYYEAKMVILNLFNDYLNGKIETTSTTSKDEVAKGLGYADFAEMQAKAVAGKTIIEGGYLRTELIDVDNLVARQVDVISDTSRVKISPEEGMKLYENNVVTATFTGDQIDAISDMIPTAENILITEQKRDFTLWSSNSATLSMSSGVIPVSVVPVTVEIPAITLRCSLNYLSDPVPRPGGGGGLEPSRVPNPNPVTFYAELLVNGTSVQRTEILVNEFNVRVSMSIDEPVIYRYEAVHSRKIKVPAQSVVVPVNTSKSITVQLHYSATARGPMADGSLWKMSTSARLGDNADDVPPVTGYLKIGGATFNASFYGNGLLFSKSIDQYVGMSAKPVKNGVGGSEFFARAGAYGLKLDKTGVYELSAECGWDRSGLLLGYKVDTSGNITRRFGIKDDVRRNGVRRLSTGKFRITHNIGNDCYACQASYTIHWGGSIFIDTCTSTYTDVGLLGTDSNFYNTPFSILFFGNR